MSGGVVPLLLCWWCSWISRIAGGVGQTLAGTGGLPVGIIVCFQCQVMEALQSLGDSPLVALGKAQQSHHEPACGGAGIPGLRDDGATVDRCEGVAPGVITLWFPGDEAAFFIFGDGVGHGVAFSEFHSDAKGAAQVKFGWPVDIGALDAAGPIDTWMLTRIGHNVEE